MILADVVGHVVSTAKHPTLVGLRLMIVRPVAPSAPAGPGANAGPAANGGADFMAVDSVGSGVGERVLVVVEGRSANDAARRQKSPLDAAIVGIVDELEMPASARKD